jgi:uncharacterized membrane protein YciS (DUF1049 family)
MNWQRIVASVLLIIGIGQFIASTFMNNMIGSTCGIIMIFCGGMWLHSIRLGVLEYKIKIIEEEIKKLRK